MKTEDRWFEDYRVGESRTSVGRTITETDVVHARRPDRRLLPAPHGRRVDEDAARRPADRARHADPVRRGRA